MWWDHSRRDWINDLNGPVADAYPYTLHTDDVLKRLAALMPKTLALMHGSNFAGDGEQALKDLSVGVRLVLA